VIRNLTYCLFTVLTLLGLQSSYAQNADALIDREEILIGEQAELTLSCRISKENPENIVFPILSDTVVNKVEIVSQSGIDTLQTGEDASETRLEQKFYITSFDTGYYVIPPMEFTINGEVEKTAPLLLGVKTVEIDTTASIKDAKPNYSVNIGLGDYIKVYWPYAAGVLGVAILAAVIFLIIKKRKQRPAKPEPVPEVIDTRTAHEIALDELNRIRSEAIYKRGLAKQYHTEITEVLRDFIEKQFNIHTHEQTSRQILDGLKFAGLSDKSAVRLRTILFRADMVKFAKLLPETEENKQAVEEAIEFVKENQPITESADE
jgi:hypothetical protein